MAAPSEQQTGDLFSIVKVTDEHSLGQRLLQLGANLYCEGNFPTFGNRLRHVIAQGWGNIVSGRSPNGKVENLAQAFERVCGEPLVAKARKAR